MKRKTKELAKKTENKILKKHKKLVMTTQTNRLFNSLSQIQLMSLTAEIKETLAMDVEMPFSKKFTAADVWNIQRQKRTRVQRRFAL